MLIILENVQELIGFQWNK